MEKIEKGSMPLAILREAIKAVPAVKYALGVAGVASAVALIASLGVSPRVSVIGTLVMLLLMVLLVIFARLSSMPSSVFKFPAIAMTWFSLFMMIVVSGLLVSCVFFRQPLDLSAWLDSAKSPDSVGIQRRTYRFTGPFRMGRLNNDFTFFVTDPIQESAFNGRTVRLKQVNFVAEPSWESQGSFTFDAELSLSSGSIRSEKASGKPFSELDRAESAMAKQKKLHVVVHTDSNGRVPQFNAPIVWSFNAETRTPIGVEKLKFYDAGPIRVGDRGFFIQIFGWTAWGGAPWDGDHYIEFGNIELELEYEVEAK
jgi:hypothetical protein